MIATLQRACFLWRDLFARLLDAILNASTRLVCGGRLLLDRPQARFPCFLAGSVSLKERDYPRIGFAPSVLGAISCPLIDRTFGSFGREASLWGLLLGAFRGCAFLIAASLQRVIGGIRLRSMIRAMLTEG